MILTPTLDLHRLHPIHGYARDFAPGQFEKLCQEQKERFEALSASDKIKATKEYEIAYPRTSNQDGR